MVHLQDQGGKGGQPTHGIDIHRLTAAKMFDVSPDKVTGDQRKAAKWASFVALYGETPNTQSNASDETAGCVCKENG